VARSSRRHLRGLSLARKLCATNLKQIERESIVTALERAHWRISGAGGTAELPAINPNALASRMRSLGIKRSKRPD
jgi:transcriptional regulator with GAF, ATPase, and Fis domain